VVEDDVDSGNMLCRRLTSKGYDVEVITPASPLLEDTIEMVVNSSDAALCDHRLKEGLAVSFSGAELVAALYDIEFPALLFTGVQPEEKYAIRRRMAQIPGFLHRDDEGGLGPERVLGALEDTVQEVLGKEPPPRRQARRTPVTVTSSRLTGGEALVEILISGWSGGGAIEVPADLLSSPWRQTPREAVGKTFFAWVNLGESDSDLVFLRDVESEALETSSFFDSDEA
jgi:hypothetical protein